MINGKPVHAATENTGRQTTDAISLMSRQVNSQSLTRQNTNLASGGGNTGSQAASSQNSSMTSGNSQNSSMTSGNSQSSASSQVNAVQTVNILADTNPQNDDQTSSKLSVDQLESATTPTAALAARKQTATRTTSTSTDTTTEKSIDVDSWDALNNAIYKGDYTVINITKDIDAGSSKNGGDRISAGSVADRDFTINGNGHSINFANNSYRFKTSGSTNRTI